MRTAVYMAREYHGKIGTVKRALTAAAMCVAIPVRDNGPEPSARGPAEAGHYRSGGSRTPRGLASVTGRRVSSYVASEAADKISLVRFGVQGGRLDHDLTTGIMPVDIDGPHGLTMSPDRQFYYVSLAHGQPFGSVWKYSTKDDAVVGRVTVGLFPATMQVTPDGEFLYVVNFNLHGDMVPSSVSVIATGDMLEVARIQTCTMPHGSRINPQGTKHYSACMMDDMLVEIDTATLKVSRHFIVTKGAEAGMGAHRRRGPPPRAPRTRCRDTGSMRRPHRPRRARRRGRSRPPTAARCSWPATRRTRSSRSTRPAGR